MCGGINECAVLGVVWGVNELRKHGPPRNTLILV